MTKKQLMAKNYFAKLPVIVFSVTLLLFLSAHGAASQETVTLMTHDSFNVSKEVIAIFEKEHNAKVRFLKSGDAGAALIQAILSKNNPLADVFYGIDNSFLSRGLQADIFSPYNSPLLSTIPEELKLDDKNRLLPVDYGDVCLNFDKKWFTDNKLSVPTDLSDLVKPEYKGLTVVQNPATSSPGMAFLLATVGKFGNPGFLEFWQNLKENDVLIAGGWEDAYFGHFSAASKGNRPIVVSYASSPPAAVHYSEKPLEKAPTQAMVTDNNAFRQIEFVGILKGTKNRHLAEKLIDFMLSLDFQEDIPLQMFVFPANSNAKLPEVFIKFSEVAKQPVEVSPEAIEQNREKWIQQWTDTMLR